MAGPGGEQPSQLTPNQESCLEALDHVDDRDPAFMANAGVQGVVLFGTMFNGSVKG